MISNYFQKNQPSIQREVQKKCMLCTKQFRIGRSQHQCKRCLRAICSDCGKEKIMLFKTGFARNPHRGCKLCVEEINNFHQYISSNQIAFGKMSVIGQKWTKKIDKLSSYLPAENRKKNQFRREIFSRMWDSYNYSMRQFIGLLTFEKHQQEIYQSLSQVIKTVFSIFPNQDLESICYLSIFFLCFCTPDKAALLCLHVIQLQKTVVNSPGLVEAYLKALGMNEQKKIQQYVKVMSPKYLSSLSINIAHTNSSIYLIDKIITRRKIDEVYIFFCLSIDLIKDTIIKGKEDMSMCNLLLARNCSPNAVSIKYRQVNNVKSSAYMKQADEELVHSTSNLTATSFLDTKPLQKKNTMVAGFKNFVESPINAKKSNESVYKGNIQFQKQYGAEVNDDSNDNDDSMSTISMLQEMKELRRTSPQHSDNKQILALLNVDEGHPYEELSLVKYQSSMEASAEKYSSKGFGFAKQPQVSEPQRCRQCQIYFDELESLRKEVKQYYRISEMMEILKEDNHSLKQKIKRLQQESERKQLESTSNRENILTAQRSELDSQLRSFKQTISEYQQREREYQQRERDFQQKEKQLQFLDRESKLKDKQYQQIAFQNEENLKVIKKQSIEIKRLQSQQEETGMTVKMLKNRLENQSLESRSFQQRQSQSTDSSTSESKVVEMLKNNVKDKNAQIEELTKRNKLLSYQLEDLSKTAKKDQETATTKAKLQRLDSEREGMMKKLNELSLLLMNEEGEKLRLSEQNFSLKQLLKQNKVAYEG